MSILPSFTPPFTAIHPGPFFYLTSTSTVETLWRRLKRRWSLVFEHVGRGRSSEGSARRSSRSCTRHIVLAHGHSPGTLQIVMGFR